MPTSTIHNQLLKLKTLQINSSYDEHIITITQILSFVIRVHHIHSCELDSNNVYTYSLHKNNYQKILPAHTMITNCDFILRGSYFYEKFKYSSTAKQL